MSSDQVRSDYLFLHVATSRISEMECYVVATGGKWECVIGRKSLMSRGQPLWSMGQFSTVGSVLVAVAEWSCMDGVLQHRE